MSEDTKREDRYIQFPLCLLLQTYQDPIRGLNLILYFGIVHYSKSCTTYELRDVARQLMYSYYRNKAMIQASLDTKVNRYITSEQIEDDEDYNGFCGATFDPEPAIEDILKLFESDPDFKADAILRHQIEQAARFLDLTIGSMNSVLNGYTDALSYQNKFERTYGKDAMPSVKPTQLIEFRDSGKDLDLFRAYIGIKSMIGMRSFISSNKPAILSRMIGCKSKAAFEYYTTNKNNKEKSVLPTVEKYSKRYHMDKLLLTLAGRKYIMFLSKEKVSVIYLSKFMAPLDLAKLIKETKDRNNLKQQIRDATASL